jgi:hypothetical protein
MSSHHQRWAYYTDEGSRDEVFSFNVATRIKCAGHHQHYGTDNLITNNIYENVNVGDVITPGRSIIKILDCDGAIRSSQHTRDVSTCDPDTNPKANCCCHPGCDQGKCSNFKFTKNIVYQPGNYTGALVVSGFVHGLDNFTFDDNVYYKSSDPSGKSAAFNTSDTFKTWQANGKDAHSVVTNPQFANLTSFSLEPASPAFPLGFKAIDISTVGPRGEVGPVDADGWHRAAKTDNVAEALGAHTSVGAGLILP